MVNCKFILKLSACAFLLFSPQNVQASQHKEEFEEAQERMSLKGQKIGGGKLARLVDFMERKKVQIKELDLRDNFIDAPASMSLKYVLQTNSDLETLNLENNKLNSQALRNIAKGLKKNTGLKKLNLKGNPFSMTFDEFKELVGKERLEKLEVDFPASPQKEGPGLVDDPDDVEEESSSGSEHFSEEEGF